MSVLGKIVGQLQSGSTSGGISGTTYTYDTPTGMTTHNAILCEKEPGAFFKGVVECDGNVIYADITVMEDGTPTGLVIRQKESTIHTIKPVFDVSEGTQFVGIQIMNQNESPEDWHIYTISCSNSDIVKFEQTQTDSETNISDTVCFIDVMTL